MREGGEKGKSFERMQMFTPSAIFLDPSVPFRCYEIFDPKRAL